MDERRTQLSSKSVQNNSDPCYTGTMKTTNDPLVNSITTVDPSFLTEDNVTVAFAGRFGLIQEVSSIEGVRSVLEVIKRNLESDTLVACPKLGRVQVRDRVTGRVYVVYLERWSQ